jgi:hypothetical protein
MLVKRIPCCELLAERAVSRPVVWNQLLTADETLVFRAPYRLIRLRGQVKSVCSGTKESGLLKYAEFSRMEAF